STITLGPLYAEPPAEPVPVSTVDSSTGRPAGRAEAQTLPLRRPLVSHRIRRVPLVRLDLSVRPGVLPGHRVAGDRKELVDGTRGDALAVRSHDVVQFPVRRDQASLRYPVHVDRAVAGQGDHRGH